MTLLVRDEEDILRTHLDYHLGNGVDDVILMDNCSVDGTVEIAREYERTGRVHYMFQPQDDYSQGHWVTQMASRAANEFCADWVINSDADEFWWPDHGSIKDALAAVGPQVIAVSVERTNFVPRVENGEPFWRRMDIRHRVSLNIFGETLPAKLVHRALRGVVVEQGNHRIFVFGRVAPSVPGSMTILHFPTRSRDQFRNKIVKGGAAYARNRELDSAFGATWRHLYRLYGEGTLDEAYDREVLDEDAIAAGLASGALVRDRRLMQVLDSRSNRHSASMLQG